MSSVSTTSPETDPAGIDSNHVTSVRLVCAPGGCTATHRISVPIVSSATSSNPSTSQ
jgi:hypothetical protein